MIAETISLGILSLPSVLATVGMVPGAVLIVGLGIVATYSGYVIGQFKMAHPWVSKFHNFLIESNKLTRKPSGPQYGRRGICFISTSRTSLRCSGPRILWRCTNNISDLQHGKPYFDMDDLPEHSHRRSCLHDRLGNCGLDSFLDIRYTSDIVEGVLALLYQLP